MRTKAASAPSSEARRRRTGLVMAGATAVAVGTANVSEPQTALRVITGIRDCLGQKKIGDAREIISSVRTGKSDSPPGRKPI